MQDDTQAQNPAGDQPMDGGQPAGTPAEGEQQAAPQEQGGDEQAAA